MSHSAVIDIPLSTRGDSWRRRWLVAPEFAVKDPCAKVVLEVVLAVVVVVMVATEVVRADVAAVATTATAHVLVAASSATGIQTA